jgi:hypothetical protein
MLCVSAIIGRQFVIRSSSFIPSINPFHYPLALQSIGVDNVVQKFPVMNPSQSLFFDLLVNLSLELGDAGA